jgi:hypothetical protein
VCGWRNCIVACGTAPAPAPTLDDYKPPGPQPPTWEAAAAAAPAAAKLEAHAAAATATARAAAAATKEHVEHLKGIALELEAAAGPAGAARAAWAPAAAMLQRLLAKLGPGWGERPGRLSGAVKARRHRRALLLLRASTFHTANAANAPHCTNLSRGDSCRGPQNLNYAAPGRTSASSLSLTGSRRPPPPP